MFELAATFVDFSEAAFMAAILTFARVAGIVGLMPGFGEQFIPARIRLVAALTFSVVVFPMLDQSALQGAWTPLRFGAALIAEIAVGVVIGLGFRLLVMALQLAGSIAAQTTALAQIAGAGIAPDPMPAIGNVLVLSGLALAVVLDLHLKAIEAIIVSYDVVGFGGQISGADLAAWGLSHAVRGFSLAFSLAAPFVLAAFLYNIALGAINRAMPQLMVAFVGAPAITGATLMLLLLAGPVMLTVWSDRLDYALAFPLGPPR